MSLDFYVVQVPIHINWATEWWTVDYMTCRKDAPIEGVIKRADWSSANAHAVVLVRDQGQPNKAKHTQSLVIVRSRLSAWDTQPIPDCAGPMKGSFVMEGHLWLVFLARPQAQPQQLRPPQPPDKKAPAPSSQSPSESGRKGGATAPSSQQPSGVDDLFGSLS